MMRRHPRLALAGCVFVALEFVSGSVAQTTAARPPAAGQYRIAGTVVDAGTGKPVQQATVAILSKASDRTIATTTTDSDGRFAFDHLAESKYPLTASKRGYRTAFYDEHDDYNSAIVTGPEQDTEHLIFMLWPGAEVHGIVTADGGDPVETARVMLFKRTNRHRPNEQMTLAGSTLTDDTGAYEFGNQAPGEYVIAVIAQPWYAMHKPDGKPADANSTALDVAYPVTFFDSTTEEASASVLKLTEGAREEADISLHAAPALRISVKMGLRADGRLARPELRQYVFGLDVGAQSAGFLDELKSGVVEFSGISPGHYELSQGDPPHIVQLDANASQQIDPNAGISTAPVTGTLRVPGSAADREMMVLLAPVNGTRGAGMPVPVGLDGRFSFDSVPTGTWALSAGANGQMLRPVRSIASGSVVQEGNLLTVGDHPLEIVATTSTGEKRLAEIEVLSRRDQSDSDGSFALSQVQPGKYTVIAVEGGWDLDLSEPTVLARYLPRGTPVLVTDTSGEVMHLAGPVTVQPR
jgi:5-hydroxyisourate hydrolase-like protein (transthyretin family)